MKHKVHSQLTIYSDHLKAARPPLKRRAPEAPRSMNFPAASRGVSVNDNLYPDAASSGELNPTEFAISTAHSFLICVICEICGLNPAVRLPGVKRACLNFSIVIPVMLMVFLIAPVVHSAQVTLAWDYNQENDIAGYRLYYGYSSGNYSQVIDVGRVNQHEVIGLQLRFRTRRAASSPRRYPPLISRRAWTRPTRACANCAPS